MIKKAKEIYVDVVYSRVNVNQKFISIKDLERLILKLGDENISFRPALSTLKGMIK